MSQNGDNTWHRCLPVRDASPNPQSLQRRIPGMRRASLAQSRGPPRPSSLDGDLGDPAGTCSPRRGVAGVRDGGHLPALHPFSPGDLSRSEADSGTARATAASLALPSTRPPGARPALTGLGRVAVHGIGRDVHLLHARVLPARQGPHDGCDRGVAGLPSQRLSAPAGRTPDAGVGVQPRPARLRRCGGGGGERPAGRAPFSAGHRGGASALRGLRG